MQTTTIEGFWAEMSPCEHFVQIYSREEEFMRALAAFIGDGLETGDSAVVIATPGHRSELTQWLAQRGIDVAAAQNQDQLILLDAEQTLASFMVDGWPDKQRFDKVISEVLMRAARGGRKVRAFGEMVALMWAQGHCGATVRLEHFWTEICKREEFMLFCAYPKAGFTKNTVDSIKEICAVHSRVLAA